MPLALLAIGFVCLGFHFAGFLGAGIAALLLFVLVASVSTV